MAITLIASVSAAPGAGGGATTAIDTTGATLIVVSIADYSLASAGTVTDSKGNTYTPLSSRQQGAARHRFWYCLAPTVGTGHTFTRSVAASYPAIVVFAFAGVASYESQSGATGNQPLVSGSLTPSANGALVVVGRTCAVAATDTVAPAVFTLTKKTYLNGTNLEGTAGYYVQPTAAAINPTWTWAGGTGSANDNAVATAVFLAVTTPTVPDVVGLSLADATTALTAAGFTVGTVTTILTDAVPAGDVVSQSPVAGTSAAPGSAVDLVLAVAPGVEITIDGVERRVRLGFDDD